MQYLLAQELVSYCVSSGKNADHLKENFVTTINVKTKKNLLICCRRIQTLPDGTAHGKEWIYCSGSGLLQMESDWKDGLLHGKRKIFFEGTSQVSSTRDYVDGLENGKLISYYPEGDVELEAETKDGFFHGKWVSFVDGYPKVEREYAFGVREGKNMVHSMNGKYTDVTYYKNSQIVPEKSERVKGINPRPFLEDGDSEEEYYDDEIRE
ncbi:hypothetical protein [Brazilian marseillevirus]|uniref:hypothetical protein n=1 Tax=Brazilian marseillevirus TaxID=1813599 RepID=UPI000782DBE5|nr:hypothetical protein A3303_gp341 [Brazilian marseillevirus]AMQ10849.1 hypothetical protein [Brazilian marseillevirus]